MITMRTLKRACVALGMTGLCATALAGEPQVRLNRESGPVVSFATLLDEMVDLEAPARWPQFPFTLKQASSYDRLAKEPGNYNWFANRDWSNFLREEKVKTPEGERIEQVMLDEPGPGALVRFWAGGFTNRGVIRLYLDGATEPVLSGTPDELLGGPKYFPPPFAAIRAKGRNLYAPIPYAKHVKVTYDGPLPAKPEEPGREGLWYSINYRAYGAGTPVESFSTAALAAMQAKLRSTADSLSSRERLEYRSTGTLTAQQVFRAPSCQERRGPAALTKLQLRIRAPDREAALRQTVLSMSFDGHQTVEVPVGDFFGSGIGLNAFEDRWRRIDAEGNLLARWVMPYRQRCDIQLVNQGTQTVQYEYADESQDWQWDERSLYFHAGWRRETFEAEHKGDFNYLTVRGGRGVYVGDTLALFNPVRGWWGEGDEKIWVDAEKFPAHFGTGTEDYYGYAWSSDNEFFTSPFHAQPTRHPNPEHKFNQGHTTNSRVRVLDGIPFRESLKVDMEVWAWQPARLDYAVTTFWYGDAAAASSTGLEVSQLSVPGR